MNIYWKFMYTTDIKGNNGKRELLSLIEIILINLLLKWN